MRSTRLAASRWQGQTQPASHVPPASEQHTFMLRLLCTQCCIHSTALFSLMAAAPSGLLTTLKAVRVPMRPNPPTVGTTTGCTVEERPKTTSLPNVWRCALSQACLSCISREGIHSAVQAAPLQTPDSQTATHLCSSSATWGAETKQEQIPIPSKHRNEASGTSASRYWSQSPHILLARRCEWPVQRPRSQQHLAEPSSRHQLRGSRLGFHPSSRSHACRAETHIRHISAGAFPAGRRWSQFAKNKSLEPLAPLPNPRRGFFWLGGLLVSYRTLS